MSDESSHVPDNPPPAADPQSVEGLFLSALGQASVAEREAFLDEACGVDVERRRRVEALLRAYEDAGSFLEKPPAGVDSSATVSLDFLTPSDDPSLLGMLGSYEVYEVLGRGGMGIVFRARDPKLNRVVAIKVLAPELAANPNARRRFLREARAAASISHPHVVTIHAVDEGSAASTIPEAQRLRDGSQLPFLVMECIVGQTLQQKLDKQGSLRLTEILRIGHQVANGLAAAHKQGLIHRDIKPANILLENGVERVKITDFGLARAADDVSITRTGEVSGTPQYMSPEQASGDVIDHRSDLFSLGCVLYAMCTGRSPFRATSLAAAIRRVCDDTPRPIDEINPEVPGWLINIVDQLLAKNPDERIQTADEVAELLGDHLMGAQQPRSARAAGSSRRSPTPATVQSTRKPFTPAFGHHIPLRALMWIGSLLLLTPVLIGLWGLTLAVGPGVIEGAFVAGMICIPTAVVIFAIALLDRSLRDNPFANAMFLLCCILLGPIGILLYLVRRDEYLSSNAQREELPPDTARKRSEDEAPPSPGSSGATVPAWIVQPLPGPWMLFGLLLLAAAAVITGQGIEQWSDVSEEVGVCLFITAGLLGVLGIQCLLGTGRTLSSMHWLAIGLAAVPLMFFGAQGPDREFKRGLAEHVDAVTYLTFGFCLSIVPLILVLHGLYRHRDDVIDDDSLSIADRLSWPLILSGVFVWLALTLLGLAVGADLLVPPPLMWRDSIDGWGFAAVYYGGILFSSGLILGGYVVTPGMVRRAAKGADSRESPGQPTSPLGGNGARAFAWIATTGVILTLLLIAVMIGGYLNLSRAQQAEREASHRQLESAQSRIRTIAPSRPLNEQESDGFPPARSIPLGDGPITTSDPSASSDPFAVPQMGAGSLPLASPTGTVRLDFKETGLGFAFVPAGKSAPPAANRQPTVYGPGDDKKEVTLPTGSYRVMVEDRLGGWYAVSQDGELKPVQYESSTIEIAPDEFVDLTIKRNFRRMVIPIFRPPQTGNYPFHWRGQTYDFTQQQAFIIQYLLQHYARGEPDVHEAVLLKGGTAINGRVVEEPMSRRKADEYLEKVNAEGHSVKGIFDDGEHPAWGIIIIEGDEPHTYRLAELQSPAPAEEPDDSSNQETKEAPSQQPTPPPAETDLPLPDEQDTPATEESPPSDRT